MKIKYKEAAVVVEKGVVVSFEAGYRTVSAHPFLVVFVFFLYLLYCFLPGLFGFLANSSPVILCTTILLGALLSHGNPNIPDIDEEEEEEGEESVAQDHGARNRSIFIEKEQERDGDSIGKSPDNDVAVSQAEDDREKKVDDGGFVCLDSSSSSLRGLLLKKAVDVSGDASKSSSDGEESCSPDASMADILPLLDELHPFFNPGVCRPVRVNIDDSDDTSGTYSDDEESEVDSSSEEEEDASETQQLLKGAGHAAAAADDGLYATAWNADDMRNFKDLKSSELERNQRLENLIAKRKARKKVTGLGNFIDLDQSTLDRYSNLQISNVSTRRGSKSKWNPFDDPEENSDRPPIPSSAPSVFSKRNNPLEFHQPFMPGRNFPSTDDTYGESETLGVDDNSYAQFQAELAGKNRSKLSTIAESESNYIPYSSLPPIETSNIDAALREPLLSPDGENLEENIMIQSMADDENEHVTTEAHSMAEFDVIPDHYLVCDVPKIAEPPLDESGVELPTDLSTDDVFKITSDSKYESLLSELDAVGDFSAHQTDQMFRQHSDSDQTGSDSHSHSDSTEIEAASPKQHTESGNESDSAAPKGKEESKNIDSSSDSGSKSSSIIDGTHKTSEVHSELHEAGDTHFVLIHDRELIEDKRENPTEEKEHTDDMDVDDDLPFSLPEDMDVALKRLFRQSTMKKKGLLEDGVDSEKQQEDLHWELRRLFRQNTLKKRSKLDETEKQQQEDFLSALKLLFKEKTTFAQEKDNRQTEKDDDDDDDDEDTTVQDMHMALKRLFRQFSFAPERSNELKDVEDIEQCEKKVEMDIIEMPMPSNLVQAEACPSSSSDASQFEQTSSEFVEISDSSQVASISNEHKQSDKLIDSLDMIQENAHSDNEPVSVPEEASQIPSKPHDSN